MLRLWAEQVKSGRTVKFRPVGTSMVPLIKSKDEVEVAPLDHRLLAPGDIVLVKVEGAYRVHLVQAVDQERGRALIANSHGHLNGWAGFKSVYGIVVAVAGQERRGARDKVARPAQKR